ncbi:MAG: hypothetical protein WA667_28145 [Candidatus Nitrosopolaris sp.]
MLSEDDIKSKARILIVDDTPDITFTFKLDLEKNRFGVFNATLKELTKPCTKSNACPELKEVKSIVRLTIDRKCFGAEIIYASFNHEISFK